MVALLVAMALSACAHDRVVAHRPWSDARQLVLVTTPDWNSSRGTLRRFERTRGSWREVADATPVVIGRTGAAWGIGLHPPQRGLQKHEGDGRSPAGVFALGTAFGYAPSANTRLPYAAMDADNYCVDVDGSPLYNRIVNSRTVGASAVAGSTEPMRRDIHADGDGRYELGFVIDSNPRGKAGAGSCIFGHIWQSGDSSTAGCTAMDKSAMQSLLGWLDARAHPVYVLLPRDEYTRLESEWNLPDFAVE